MSIHNFAMSSIAGASGQGGGFYDHIIDNSLKFNDDDSAYLSWTPTSTGNRRTFTFSFWIKRGAETAGEQNVFTAGTTVNDRFHLNFEGSDHFNLEAKNGGSTVIKLENSGKYRDHAAWYHFVVRIDTTQNTASDRVRVYKNGVLEENWSSSTYPSQNTDLQFNTTTPHYISRRTWDASGYLDAYLAEFHHVDGQSLGPENFGETKGGVWIPKEVTGITYGTNGFHLPFKETTTAQGFNAVTWKGNSPLSQSISGLGFSPDLVWIKSRSQTYNHVLADTVRGQGKDLYSNTTSAESSTSSELISFDADGFSVGSGGSANDPTGSLGFVAWAWDAGSGSAASNTDGSITSTVKANPAYGFSIVSYTGSGANATVGHGLGVKPKIILTKRRNATSNWGVASTLWADKKQLVLNEADALSATNNNLGIQSNWTNTVFTVGTEGDQNGSGGTYIAYCFAEVAGYSSIGSYSGTDSAGVTVTTGFRPAFVMIKATNIAENWVIIDNTRNPANPANSYLNPNTSSAEGSSSTFDIDFTDTGFVLQGTDDAINGYSGGTGEYIYMAFADTREAAFWKDVSGQGNHWTPNNLDYRDSLPDSPANNFAVMNILDDNYASPKFTYSEGNLKYTYGYSGTGFDRVFGTIAISPDDTNKYYFEFTANVTNEQMQWGVVSTDSLAYSIADRDNGLSATANASQLRWVSYLSAPYLYRVDSSTTDEGTLLSTSNGNAANGAIYSIVYDAGVGKFYAWFNGVEFTGQNYAVGTSLWATMDTSKTYMVMMYQGDGGASTKSGNMTANFGADSSFAGAKPRQGNTDANGLGDFYYTVPQDALALCTANLPTPTIIDGSEHFNTVTYTGTGTTNSITGVGFQPDWVWGKQRSGVNSHELYDTVRGVNQIIYSDLTDAEGTNANGISSFDADGYTVAGNTSINLTSASVVAWNWKAGGAAVSNTDGSITSQVSANTDAGFSIVQFVGDANGSSTVGHGLSKTPNMVIVKPTSQADSWPVYHSSLGVNKTILLEVTNAEISSSGYWGSVTPSVFGLSAGGTNNRSGATHIAYCFADTDGYLKAGSYTGNGSTDGPFVYTGFRPSWLMIKRTDSTGGWVILDVERDTFNVMDSELNASSSAAETSPYSQRDYLSNGFKIRNTQSDHNASGGTYIYLAFAEVPFKVANAR